MVDMTPEARVLTPAARNMTPGAGVLTGPYIGVAYNPSTEAWQRLGDAQGFDVGSLLPMGTSLVLSRLRRVVLADDGSVYKGVSWLDFTKHEDGTDVDLAGGNGQIMVEYLPTYYKVGVDGDWYYILLSHLPLYGYTLFPLFNGASAYYRGAYEASVYNDGTNKLCSIAKDPSDGSSNVYPVTSRSEDWGYSGLTAQATETLAGNRGTGWEQENLLSAIYERMLMIVAFASYNIPGIVGNGRISLGGGSWVNDSYLGPLGLGDSAGGYHSAVQVGGTDGYLTDYSQVLGIENPWGHIWKRVASLISDYDVYYGGSDYSSTDGWTRLVDALDAGITLPSANGYAGDPHSGLGLVLPATADGSSSSGMYDYYYQASGLRVLRVGGTADHGSAAGPFAWSAAYSAAYTYASVGGRLCFKKAA